MAIALTKIRKFFNSLKHADKDQQLRFQAPGVGGKWELEIEGANYDEHGKTWVVDLHILGPVGTGEETHEHRPDTHEHAPDGTIIHGVPVADEPSDT